MAAVTLRHSTPSASCRVRKQRKPAQTCVNTAQTFSCLRTICANMRKHAQTCVNLRQCLRRWLFPQTKCPLRKPAQTLRKHCANIAQTCANLPLRKHCANIAQTLRKHCANIAQTLRKHCGNIVQTTYTLRRPAKKLIYANTAQKLRKNCANTAQTLRKPAQTLK